MTKIILCVCLAAFALVLLSGASPARQVPGAIKVEVHLVEVYATVHDHRGGYRGWPGARQFPGFR